jgi:ribosomal protein S18 acetylase RimI-like enzyme
MNNHDLIPQFFRLTASLSATEVSLARKILGDAQPFNIYFNAALAAKEKTKMIKRWIHFSRAGGLTMGIDFDDLRVFSTLGSIDDEVADIIGNNPRRTEFHVPFDFVERLKAIGINRLLREDHLRYYSLQRLTPFEGDFSNLRRLSKADLPLVEQFYTTNYDGTIFSSWMIEQPFWGLFLDGQLTAAGGTIVIDKLGCAANIGNFLTAPSSRGRGYGKIVAQRLINDLIEMGLQTFTLGTTEENIAAWKTYEAVGFRLLEQRAEIEFSAVSNVGE